MSKYNNIANYWYNFFKSQKYHLKTILKLFFLYITCGHEVARKYLAIKRFDYNQNHKYNILHKELSKKVDLKLLSAIQTNFKIKPKISIVMPVYKTPIIWLKQAIDSIIAQNYENWELCIVDDNSCSQILTDTINEYVKTDSRIKFINRTQSGHISAATNSGIEIATGEFLLLMDHDDLLPKYALHKVVEYINNYPNAKLLYSDEDKIDENNNHFSPYFKPDFNYQLFLGQNLISHLGVYKLSIIKEIGGFNVGLEGSQDYDLALRFIERIQHCDIIHIPHVLYHWRAISGSTALDPKEKKYPYKAAIQSLDNHLARLKIAAKASSVNQDIPHHYKVEYKLDDSQNDTVIFIDDTKLNSNIINCLDSIVKINSFSNYQLVIICSSGNESKYSRIIDLYKNTRVELLYENNFSETLKNFLKKYNYKYCLVINSDLTFITQNWLSEMLSLCQLKTSGLIGIKLIYKHNYTIAHAGILFLEDKITSFHHNFNSLSVGYFARLILRQEVTAIERHCYMFETEKFMQVGEFSVSDNLDSIDLSLKMIKNNYQNIFTPNVEAYINESTDLYSDINLSNEIQYSLNYDKSYNPNLNQNSGDFNYNNMGLFEI